MDVQTMFKQAITLAGRVILEIDTADWDRPTPCSEWDLKQLVNHMVYEVLWIPDLLAGKTVAEVGNKYDGDVLSLSPAESWNHATIKAREAVDGMEQSRTVALSHGNVPAEDYIREVSGDVVIHGWDVARSLGVLYEIPEELLQNMWGYIEPRAESYQNSGLFAPPVPVPEDASLQTKLLGLVGRKA